MRRKTAGATFARSREISQPSASTSSTAAIVTGVSPTTQCAVWGVLGSCSP